MTNGSTKPIIFLAFANDRDDRVRDRYLRNLPEEARRLQRALEAAEREDLCEVVVKQNATIDDYRNGIPPLRTAHGCGAAGGDLGAQICPERHLAGRR